MEKFESILRGNREALAMAAKLIELASAMPFDVKAVAHFRHEMIKRVSQQINDKSRQLIEPLRNAADPAVRAIAHRYTSEALTLRHYLAEHHGRWTIQAIEADPREYRLALRVQLKRMQAHLEWEETVLMPAAASGHLGQLRRPAA